MRISDKGLDLIKSFEGYHTALPDGGCKAYLDKLAAPPIWTIGWGCTEGIEAGMVWTLDEATAALRRELEKHEAIVTRCVTVEIGQNNFDALVSFQYNTGGLPKSTLLRKLNAGDFDGAAREFDKWNKAGGKIYKGLIRRRAAERALFEQDARDEALPPGAPDMPQQVDQPAADPPSRPTVAVIATGATAVVSQANEIGAALTTWQGMAQTYAGLNLKMLGLAAIIGIAVWGGTIMMGRLHGR